MPEDLGTKIKQLTMQLEKVQKEKNEYLQNIAHQLTAPLNAIKWSIESVFMDEVPIDRKLKLLNSIKSQGTMLVHLIKNFTLMSDLEAGHNLEAFRDEPKDVNLEAIVKNFANDFQPQALYRKTTITVDDESFKTNAVNKMIWAIEPLVYQVVYNVIENAVKYSDNTTNILIVFSIETDYAILSISSTGIPISELECENLLNRGTRGEIAKKKFPAGTGFGLYIVKKIMEIHRGKIEISPNGNVTTVKLLFPQKK